MVRIFGIWLLLSIAVFAEIELPYHIPVEVKNKIEKQYGVRAVRRFNALENLINNSKHLSIEKKLVLVNNFFNKVLWVSDIKAWGEEDYWATPLEFLGKNAGDCEDYVIAKYITLRKLGVSEKQLYLTYVEAKKKRQQHMVLAFFKTPNSIPLILDNINYAVLPGTKRKDLRPIYSFNAEELFLTKAQGRGIQIPGGSDNNTKWKNFLTKLEKGIL